MKLCLILQKDIDQPVSSERALRFAKEALKAGHDIACVFFYRAAVSHARAGLSGSALELQADWQSWAEQNKVPLIVCHTVAERLGITEFAHGYQDAGLTALVQAMASAERTLQF